MEECLKKVDNLEKKGEDKIKNFVNGVTKPLVFLTLFSTNVAVSNPTPQGLNYENNYPNSFVNIQKEKKVGKMSETCVGMEKIEYERRVKVLLSSINKYRKEKGLNELILKHDLDAACQGYANYCINNDWFLGHTDKEERSFEDRLKEDAGYEGFAVECRCHGYGGPKDVVKLWKDTPEQRKNLLVENGKYISIGVAKGKYDHHITFVIIYE